MRRIFGSWNRKSAGSPYTLLKTENEEIRLATLAPGDYDDTIVIRLRIKSLSKSKAPNYEALSYAWGTDISPHNALVNGKAISISANLDSGLRHLRYEDKSRVLWIDALCIDQTDILERNSQVQLMSCIYSEARTVLIWLGPSDGDDEEAMRKIAVWQKHWDLPFFKALIRICKRPWFQRLWVVQELTLASTNPMVHLGYVLVPWDKFHNFIRATSDGTMGTKWDYVAPKGSDLHFEFWTAAKRIVSLGEMRQNRSFADFADNLADTAEFEATDARDKVYGILAMKGSSASTPAITPDYTKTIREVFVESIFYLIREDPVTLYKRLPLHPLRKEHSKPPSTALGLPSWAMDLTITSRNPDDGHFYNRPILLTPGYIYSTMSAMAQKGLQSIARLSSNNTLHAVGAFIGSIVITSEDLLLSTHTDYRAPGSVPISIKTLHGIYNNMLKPRNISTESLLRALCSRDIHADTVLTESQSEVLRHLTATAQNLILFVTREGHVGLSYHPDAINGIRPGDVVVGLFGINLPFILRRSVSSKDYNMVNIAFVAHHICSHPALKDAPEGTTENDVWENLEKFGLQEYTIV